MTLWLVIFVLLVCVNNHMLAVVMVKLANGLDGDAEWEITMVIIE